MINHIHTKPAFQLQDNTLSIELMIEIMTWVQPENQREYFFFMVELPSLSKEWYHILRCTHTGNYFYKQIYEMLFGWNLKGDCVQKGISSKDLLRKSLFYFPHSEPALTSWLTEQEEEPIGIWFEILKYNVRFYMFAQLDLSLTQSLRKQKQDLKPPYTISVKRNLFSNHSFATKLMIEKDPLLINRPLRYQSGKYYFEVVCEKELSRSDNVLFGAVISTIDNQECSSQYFVPNSYLGCNENTCGYYFIEGCLLRSGRSPSLGGRILVNDTLGMIIDTDAMKMIYIHNGKVSKITIDLSEVFPLEKFSEFYEQKAAIYPAISMLYDGDVMRLQAFEVCSFERCKSIREYLQYM